MKAQGREVDINTGRLDPPGCVLEVLARTSLPLVTWLAQPQVDGPRAKGIPPGKEKRTGAKDGGLCLRWSGDQTATRAI